MIDGGCHQQNYLIFIFLVIRGIWKSFMLMHGRLCKAQLKVTTQSGTWTVSRTCLAAWPFPRLFFSYSNGGGVSFFSSNFLSLSRSLTGLNFCSFQKGKLRTWNIYEHLSKKREENNLSRGSEAAHVHARTQGRESERPCSYIYAPVSTVWQLLCLFENYIPIRSIAGGWRQL